MPPVWLHLLVFLPVSHSCFLLSLYFYSHLFCISSKSIPRLSINVWSWCYSLWKECVMPFRFKNSKWKVKINLQVHFFPSAGLIHDWELWDHKVKKTLQMDTCKAQPNLNVWFAFIKGEIIYKALNHSLCGLFLQLERIS